MVDSMAQTRWLGILSAWGEADEADEGVSGCDCGGCDVAGDGEICCPQVVQ